MADTPKNPPTEDAAAKPTKEIEKLAKEVEKLPKTEIKDTKEIKTEKIEVKEHKDVKIEKLEKNENKEHKDAKNEKLEKNEFKEHKDAKHEKTEKNEIKEHKDAKHEKAETKVETKEFKVEAKEIGKLEHPEKPIGKEKDGKELVDGPGDPGNIAERVGALEQSVSTLHQHFIASGQRPDLSRGALSGEPAPTPPDRKGRGG